MPPHGHLKYAAEYGNSRDRRDKSGARKVLTAAAMTYVAALAASILTAFEAD